MEKAMNIVLILSIVVEYFSFFCAVYRKEFRSKFGWKEAILFVVVMGLIACPLFLLDGGMNVELIGLPAAFLIIFIFFKLSLKMCMKLFLAAVLIMSLFVSTQSFLIDCFGYPETKSLLLCYYLSAIIWIWCLFLYTRNRFSAKIFSLDGKFGLPLTILYGIITAMITSYQFLFRHELQTSFPKGFGIFLGGVGGLLLFFIYFILLYYINTNHDYQEKLLASELYNEQQRRYFHELLEREKRTRKFRHDYQSELMVVDTYLKSGDYDKAKAYLSQMRNALDCVSGRKYYVGNEVVDIILNYYLQSISDKVDVTVHGVIGDISWMAERDITIIVSNLVRNAVEELQANSGENPICVFECMEKDGDFVIYTRNSIGISNKKKLQKGENHQGLGLFNIKETTEKYGGAFYWRIQNQMYEAQIRIPLNRLS